MADRRFLGELSVEKRFEPRVKGSGLTAVWGRYKIGGKTESMTMSHNEFPFSFSWKCALRIITSLTLLLSACQGDQRHMVSKDPTSAAVFTNGRDLNTPQITGGPSNKPASWGTQQRTSTPALSPPQNGEATPTIQCPRTILFYGDSRLGALGVSFVDDIRKLVGSCYDLVNVSYWAHTAQWGSENLQANVIMRNPDDVALWWGANDFDGCNGTTDPNTDLPDMPEFTARLNAYLTAMKNQIETIAGLGKPVYVFNEPRVNGGVLPWAILDRNNKITGYDHNHLCPWNWVSDAVEAAQKQLVADEVALGYRVTLVDVWRLYLEDGTLPDMYSTDVVHPGMLGREKIAELFVKTYNPGP